MSLKAIARQLITILLTALLGGLLGATLVRLAPGFGVQESDLNAQLSAETRQALHQQEAQERNVLSYYGHHLAELAHGDLGYSRSLNRPVLELLRDRFPETLHSIAIGVGGGWLLGIAFALPATWKQSPVYSTSWTDHGSVPVHPFCGAGSLVSGRRITGKNRHCLSCLSQGISLLAQPPH